MHIDALRERAVWFHALDHTDYGRWINPEHLQDMVELPPSHCEIAEDRGIDLLSTLEGPVRRSGTLGTEIPIGVEGHIDQAHEQNNATIKGDGGAVGLTDNTSTLQRWMVAGPEVARLTEAGSNRARELITRHKAS